MKRARLKEFHQVTHTHLGKAHDVTFEREQRDLVRSGKKGAMPSAGCAYAKNYI